MGVSRALTQSLTGSLTSVLAGAGASVLSAFWNTVNGFASQASYDAYMATASVRSADRSRAVLLTQAVAQTLGISNTVATTNPPGTVTLRDGTLGYGAHNYLRRSGDLANGVWAAVGAATLTPGIADPDGGTGAFQLDMPSAGTGLRQVSIPNMQDKLTASAWIKGDSAGTIRLFDLGGSAGWAGDVSVTTSWQRLSITGTKSDASAEQFAFYRNSAGQLGRIYIYHPQLNRGPVPLEYVPTTSAAVYGLRITFDATDSAYFALHGGYPQAGLVCEPARTNSVKNNTMVGAVAGSPGTLPTNWSISGSGTGGLTRTIATGTENGAPYLDLKYAGTATGGAINIIFESTAADASAAQKWTSSLCWRLIAGTTTRVSSPALNIDWGNPGYLATDGTVVALPTAIESRPGGILTSPAGTTKMNTAYLQLSIAAGAVDFTIRLKVPQWEAGDGATSPILTSGSVVTRSADLNAGLAAMITAAGPETLMVELSVAKASSGATQAVVASTSNGIAAGIDSTGHALLYDGTNTIATAAALSDNVPAKIATRWGASAAAVCLNGGTVATGSFDGSMGTSGQPVGIGDDGFGAGGFSGGIRRIAISTQVASDAQLQAASAGTL